jgi:thiol-disulfide isomerase/thioredoxin
MSRPFRRFKSASFSKQGGRLYLTAVLLGLFAGGLMIYLHKHSDNAASLACQSSSAVLAQAAHGSVAAFVPSRRGTMLPPVSFEDGNGVLRRLENFRGKTVLLNLWATWCPPCREEMPALDALQAKKGSDDFSVIALSLDEGGAEKPKAFFKEAKINSLGFYHDGSGAVFSALRQANLLAGLPTSILIDREGCVLGVLAGPADWKSEEALKLIDAALTVN